MRPQKYEYVKLGESQYFVDRINDIISNIEKYITKYGEFIYCQKYFFIPDPKIISSVLGVTTKTYSNWLRYGVIDIDKVRKKDSNGKCCFDATMILEMFKSHRTKQLNGTITKNKRTI